jgi:hypothetical protein
LLSPKQPITEIQNIGTKMNIDKIQARKFINRKLQRLRNECEVRRKLDFNLTTDIIMEILEQQEYKCAMTGAYLEFFTGGELDGKNPKSCSIDRINNDEGYNIDNIQLTTVEINLLRNKKSVDEFIRICKQVSACHD